jgi:large subunit ribosomal protein L17
MRVVFDELAPRYADRPGGYTRILRLATPRLGDAGARAILEFVGEHDRVVRKAEKPSFDEPEPAPEEEAPEPEEATEAGDRAAGDEAAPEAGAQAGASADEEGSEERASQEEADEEKK